MKPDEHIPEINTEIPENAVRIYGQQDAMDDFPILKAFQQYIDSEQAKARKRLLMLCVFFGMLMGAVIAVFLVMLFNLSNRNQSLNDRLIETVMKERERAVSPIVVQQPQHQQQDNSAILALTAKIEDMQKKLDESRTREEEARRRAEIEAAKPKGPTPEELEIKRLTALLAAEKEKQAAEKARLEAEKAAEKTRLEAEKAAEKARREAEKERRRQIELEEYRRKHYPELYEMKTERQPAKPDRDAAHENLLKEVDQILSDDDAISYYDDEEEPVKTKSRPTASNPASAPKKEYSIPVDVRGSSSRWRIPND